MWKDKEKCKDKKFLHFTLTDQMRILVDCDKLCMYYVVFNNNHLKELYRDRHSKH